MSVTKQHLDGAGLPSGLEWSACPICGARDGRSVHTEPMGELSSPLTGRFPKDLVMHVIRCKSCGFLYANPRPTQSILDERYQHMSDIDFNLNGQQARVRMFEHLIDRLIERHPAPGKILDVGCFTGTLLETAQSRGWEPWGVEINKVASSYAREELGMHVFTSLLLHAGFETNFFDAVAMTDVAEHVLDPKETFEEIHRILKPGGMLVMTVPNGRVQLPKEHLKRRLKKGPGVVIGGLGHVNHFSPSSVRSLLRRIGFDDVRVGVMIPERQYTAKMDRLKRLYVAAARALHAATGLHIGHELLVIARKPGAASSK
ncbi:MAG: class I SAM-dependent methyltransferase [Actinomycetota bacterium]